MSDIKDYPNSSENTCLITTDIGQKILFNFNSFTNQGLPGQARLAEEIQSELKDSGRQGLDVACFTDLMTNHYAGIEEYLYLEHSEAYQSEERIKMADIWVPSSFILGYRSYMPKSFQVIQAEARYRLRAGWGIRVIGLVGAIDEWLIQEGITPDDRNHLIVSPGELMPGMTMDSTGIEMSVTVPNQVDDRLVYEDAAKILILQDMHPGIYLAIRLPESQRHQPVHEPVAKSRTSSRRGILSMAIAAVGTVIGVTLIIMALVIGNRTADPEVVAREHIAENAAQIEYEIAGLIAKDNWIMEEIGVDAISRELSSSLGWTFSEPQEIESGHMLIALAHASFDISYDVLNSNYKLEVSIPMEMVIESENITARPLIDSMQIRHDISDLVPDPGVNTGT